jgi:hypothetical protein
MSDNSETEEPYRKKLNTAKKNAAQQLADENLQSFVLVSYNGAEMSVTLMADSVEQQTEMPMPQALLSTLIFDYSIRTNRKPLHIGQAATYAAGEIFSNPTEFDFVTDFDEDLIQE